MERAAKGSLMWSMLTNVITGDKALGARVTELEVLEIDLLRQPRGRHHAPGPAAVDETEGRGVATTGVESPCNV
jgi:hypothetical protein